MTGIDEKLREAARAGSETKLSALLREQRCDTSSTNESGMTALMWAALHGHEECVKLLLPVGDALMKDEDGLTALMMSVEQGHKNCVSLLLPASDALAKDNNGQTALMRAVLRGVRPFIELLLPRSNVQAEDGRGMTACMLARNTGCESLAQYIEAYVLAQSERTNIDAAASPGASSGRSALRV